MKVTERTCADDGDSDDRARQVIAILAAGLERVLKRASANERAASELDYLVDLPVTTDNRSNGRAPEGHE